MWPPLTRKPVSLREINHQVQPSPYGERKWDARLSLCRALNPHASRGHLAALCPLLSQRLVSCAPRLTRAITTGPLLPNPALASLFSMAETQLDMLRACSRTFRGSPWPIGKHVEPLAWLPTPQLPPKLVLYLLYRS